MGDFVRVGTGDEDADCLPQSVVALLTEEKVDFSGETPSFADDVSTLGGAISLSAVCFGLCSTSLLGNVGSGRENRD